MNPKTKSFDNKIENNLNYSFTKDVKDLENFKLLTEATIKKNFQLLAIRENKELVGGTLISVSSFKNTKNSETENNFILIEAFPEAFYQKFSYCEVLPVSNLSGSSPEIVCKDVAENIICKALLSKCSKIFHFIEADEIRIYQDFYASIGLSSKTNKVFGVTILMVNLEAKFIKTEHEEIDCIATQNRDEIESYYKIRERAFRERLDCVNFNGSEDEYDRNGIIVVAKKNDEVVGGSRLVINTPKREAKLPLEDDNFVLNSLFPELNLVNRSYGEITRFAVVPELMTGSISYELTRASLNELIDNGCYYQFSVAPMIQARNSRNICRKLGLNHVVMNHIKVPQKDTYEQYQMVLSITYLLPHLLEKHSHFLNQIVF